MGNNGLIHIADDDLYYQIHERFSLQGGAYRIIAVLEYQRVPVSRFLGTDYNGILYIGKADSFVDRITGLKKSISPAYRGTSHICGRRYKSNPKIASRFPYESLYIELFQSDQPRKLKNELLEIYESEFGEVPPLNAVK